MTIYNHLMNYENIDRINQTDIEQLVKTYETDYQISQQNERIKKETIKREIISKYFNIINREKITAAIAKSITLGKTYTTILKDMWGVSRDPDILLWSSFDRKELVNASYRTHVDDANITLYDKIKQIIPNGYEIALSYRYLEESSFVIGFKIDIYWGSWFDKFMYNAKRVAYSLAH